MNKKNHLPLMGVGPLYGIGITAVSVLGIILSHFGFLDSGKYESIRIPFIVIGILLIAVGIVMWCLAVIGCKIDKNIMENTLCTSGIYGCVRNPIYSAIMIACTGALLLCANLWLLLLPLVFWAFMTVLMKNTEEKWLAKLYGEEYNEYCKKVNRCIPWFKKK